MIATLEGRLSAIEKNALVVQIGGLGLRVYVPETLLSRCGPIGSIVSLHTHLHVREDELSLYGFASEDELLMFKLLLSVSGIGPRAGLSILSATSPDHLRTAIAQEQASVLAQIHGIGAKTARKIILDLKDKVQAVPGVTFGSALMPQDSEVIAALTALGYSLVEAQTALQHVPASAQEVEERLRAALAFLGS